MIDGHTKVFEVGMFIFSCGPITSVSSKKCREEDSFETGWIDGFVEFDGSSLSSVHLNVEASILSSWR